jgi:hypothetical protein
VGAQLMREWGTLVIALLSVAAGLYATKASREATRTSRETNQIRWLQEARVEAESAKKDLRELRSEADSLHDDMAETKREMRAAEVKLTEATDVIEELSRWALRVITWAADPTIDREELRRLINGGPSYLRRSGLSGGEPERPPTPL